MSQAEVERFVADLKSNPALLEQVRSNAAGVDSVVGLAKEHGYDITVDEAKSYIQQQTSQDLSDAQLDAVAGGKGHHHHSTSSVTQAVQVQTAATVTTEATTAETTAEVAAEAVAVIVLT